MVNNKYYDKPFVVFYVGYIKDNLEKDVSIINEIASKHKDLNMLTILMDTKDIETSSIYKESELKLNTDIVSSNSEIPKQFLDTSVISYPAALFIQDNVFTGGCHGNLQAIPKLVEGLTVEEVSKRLSGIDCRGRGTSCGDQLAQAVVEAYEASKQ